MRWKGETEDQRRDRMWRWHKTFAWFPTQMHDGTWVWLEDYYCKFHNGINGRMHPHRLATWEEVLDAEAHDLRIREARRPPPK